MNRVRSIAISALLLGLAGPLLGGENLPSDPSLVTGKLDNGFSYVIKKHAQPPGRAVIWLHMYTGSLNETDRQRGISHYLEHMAFNGSENFPPGSLVPFYQSLGMQFGRDQNAFTSFEQTTFQLTLPKADADTLGKGMTFFSDVASKLTLTPTEIDNERQIIQEERRRGLSGRQRTSNYVMEHIAPGSLYGVRLPIGTEETINGVNEKDFKEYYGKWYGASNATLIVVADADPAEVAKVIKEKFASATAKAKPQRQDPKITAYTKSFAIVASDPEITGEDLRIVRIEPAHGPTTTVEQYRDDLVLRIAESCFNRRLGEKADRGGTAYLSVRASAGDQANAMYEAGINARSNPGKWKETLNESALELQRARAFGFTSREFDDTIKQMTAGAERAVDTEATMPSSSFVSRINNDITAGEPTMSAQQRLDLLKKVLPTIKLDEVSQRFAQEFDPKTVAFILVMPAGKDVPTEAALLDLGVKALQAKPEKEAEVAHATKLLDKEPTPGTVKEGSEHAASKVWSGWLSNNVRVHYRFMDEQKNEVSIHVALVGGELLETADNRGITSAARLAWSRPATEHLTSADIRELMTGKKVSVGGGGMGGGGGRGGGRRGGGGGGGGDDSVALTISGGPDDLEPGFQLAYLLLTEPRIEPTAFTQYQTESRERLVESLKNPMSLGSRLAGSIIYPESVARTQPMTPEAIDKLTLDGAQAWLKKLISESPIEVSIVGDIPREKVMDLVARYIGALPARSRISPDAYITLRKLERPKGVRAVEKTIDTPTKQAYVYSGFYGADEINRADARALSMAARILSTRMVTEVREEAQLVYSISASSRAATTYPGFGVFSAAAPTDPSKVKPLIEKLASMYAVFAKEGPTDAELVVAKKQFANTYDEQVRQPGYWARHLQQMTFRGNSLDEVLAEPEAYQALTAAQVREVFAKYYKPDNAIVVSVTPNAPAGDVKK